jgi:hypothetical protein
MATPNMVTVDGRSEEEYRQDVNRAIADTEDEIFRAAMGDEELENDGDTSLEEMGEGPGGDVLEDEEEDVAESDEEALQAAEEEAAEEEPQEIEEELQAGEAEQEQAPSEELPRIPSYRVREESERARTAEERAIALERELAHMRGRLDELSRGQQQQPAQPQQPQRPPKPDRYTQEAEYDQWMLDEGRRLAREDMRAELAAERQERQMQSLQRMQASFANAAESEYRPQFLDAYDRLTRLDHRDPNNRALVQNIASSPDPAAALFQWFGESYQQAEPPQPRAARAPRHEVRLPPNMGAPSRRPPSLNSVGGGGPGQRVDPELYDDSDAAVFRYAMR